MGHSLLFYRERGSKYSASSHCTLFTSVRCFELYINSEIDTRYLILTGGFTIAGLAHEQLYSLLHNTLKRTELNPSLDHNYQFISHPDQTRIVAYNIVLRRHAKTVLATLYPATCEQNFFSVACAGDLSSPRAGGAWCIVLRLCEPGTCL